MSTPHTLIQHPEGWIFLRTYGEGGAGAVFEEPRLNLAVIVTVDECKDDGESWLHCSVSRENRIPSYEDLHLVKRLFIGDHRDAVQYFPVRSDHVNLHPYCLHLWHCLTRKTLPSALPGETV